MIDTKEETLSSFLYHVKKIASNENKNIFFSVTKEIAPVNLLNVFDHFDHKNTNRYYWSNHQQDFCLLGIGTAKELVCHNGEVETVRSKWHKLLEEAVEYNPFSYAGTGITAASGMAFDPTRPESREWSNYAPAMLTIPRFMLAYTEGRYFLTMNDYIDEHTLIANVLETAESFEQELYTPLFTEDQVPQRVTGKKVLKPEEWKELVQKAVQEIKNGHAKKIVLAREIQLTLNKQAHIGNMLRRLLRTQPNSYVFAYEAGDDCFIGATPERLVLVEDQHILSTCLAGTAPRGKTMDEDEDLANGLLHDEKNLEEHEYVVQMIKDSIASYCVDIHIPEAPVIYPLQNLQHLYTPVKATLKESYDVFDLIKNLHPTPALGGVPRQKALKFIRENEFMDRGWYGAPVGWLDSTRHSEFAVAIRSGLVHNDEVNLFAGCGVMRDSDPEMEFEETKVKFLPMLNVLEDNDGSY